MVKLRERCQLRSYIESDMTPKAYNPVDDTIDQSSASPDLGIRRGL